MVFFFNFLNKKKINNNNKKKRKHACLPSQPGAELHCQKLCPAIWHGARFCGISDEMHLTPWHVGCKLSISRMHRARKVELLLYIPSVWSHHHLVITAIKLAIKWHNLIKWDHLVSAVLQWTVDDGGGVNKAWQQ